VDFLRVQAEVRLPAPVAAYRPALGADCRRGPAAGFRPDQAEGFQQDRVEACRPDQAGGFQQGPAAGFPLGREEVCRPDLLRTTAISRQERSIWSASKRMATKRNTKSSNAHGVY